MACAIRSFLSLTFSFLLHLLLLIGGPIPYRLFVDTGVVMLCVLSLAPASPLVAPAALVLFALSEPLLRRNIIFMYRAKFDGGGIRWPFLFEMVMVRPGK